MEVTYCEPHDACGILEDEPYWSKQSQPVATHWESGGVAVSTGIDFNDYHRMTCRVHKNGTASQIIPEWSHNEQRFRETIVSLVEGRAFPGRNIQKNAGAGIGTHSERLARAQIAIDARREVKIARLDRLCFFFRNNRHDPVYTKKLEQQIRNLDAEICIDQNPAGFLTAVLFLAWRARMNSPQVSAQLGGVVSPAGVRQILHRARLHAEGLPGNNVGWARRGAQRP